MGSRINPEISQDVERKMLLFASLPALIRNTHFFSIEVCSFMHNRPRGFVTIFPAGYSLKIILLFVDCHKIVEVIIKVKSEVDMHVKPCFLSSLNVLKSLVLQVLLKETRALARREPWHHARHEDPCKIVDACERAFGKVLVIYLHCFHDTKTMKN